MLQYIKFYISLGIGVLVLLTLCGIKMFIRHTNKKIMDFISLSSSMMDCIFYMRSIVEQQQSSNNKNAAVAAAVTARVQEVCGSVESVTENEEAISEHRQLAINEAETYAVDEEAPAISLNSIYDQQIQASVKFTIKNERSTAKLFAIEKCQDEEISLTPSFFNFDENIQTTSENIYGVQKCQQTTNTGVRGLLMDEELSLTPSLLNFSATNQATCQVFDECVYGVQESQTISQKIEVELLVDEEAPIVPIISSDDAKMHIPAELTIKNERVVKEL